MGRKSLVVERREDILGAFERCIIRHGLDVSLERVAEEAGVQRSIIRHYIGNRDVVIEEVIERITHSYLERTTRAAERIRTAEQMLDFLFRCDEDYEESEELMVQILLSAQERFPNAKRRLRELFESLVDVFATRLREIHPHAAPAQCRQIAYGLFCIATTNDSMLWIGFAARYAEAARSSAALLIGSLAAAVTA